MPFYLMRFVCNQALGTVSLITKMQTASFSENPKQHDRKMRDMGSNPCAFESKGFELFDARVFNSKHFTVAIIF